jgi:hypothetical protein
MRTVILLFILNLLLISCEKETLQPCDINQKLENSMADVEKNIEGNWQLTGYTAGRALQIKPNLQIFFSKGAVKNEYIAEVSEDNKSIGKMAFTIIEKLEEKNLVLNSDQSKSFTNGRNNFLFGNFRICQNQLMIDHGGIFDAPVFIFDKE